MMIFPIDKKELFKDLEGGGLSASRGTRRAKPINWLASGLQTGLTRMLDRSSSLRFITEIPKIFQIFPLEPILDMVRLLFQQELLMVAHIFQQETGYRT